MGWMLVFAGTACIGFSVIAAAFWDYRTAKEKERARRETYLRSTTTTMTSGNTGYVIITYERKNR